MRRGSMPSCRNVTASATCDRGGVQWPRVEPHRRARHVEVSQAHARAPRRTCSRREHRVVAPMCGRDAMRPSRSPSSFSMATAGGARAQRSRFTARDKAVPARAGSARGCGARTQENRLALGSLEKLDAMNGGDARGIPATRRELRREGRHMLRTWRNGGARQLLAMPYHLCPTLNPHVCTPAVQPLA